MKTILFLSFFCSAGFSAYAQGSVNFANNSATPVYCDFVGVQRVPAGSYFMAELMYAPDGTPSDAFNSVAIRVGAPASFIFPGIFAGGSRTVSSITPSGGFGLFQVRVWETAYGSSYNDLVARGFGGHAGTSAILRVDTGDPTTAPIELPASLVTAGLTSFSIAGLSGGPPCIPEPSTLALALLAAFGALIFSRRSHRMKATTAIFLLATVSIHGQTDWPQLRAVSPQGGAFLPVQVVQPPDGTARFFVVEQPGVIRVYSPTHSGSDVFLDISDRVGFFFGGEEGLLSVAFPPDFATKKYFYVFYTEFSELREVLARFYVSSTNNNVADPGSEQILLNLFRTATTVNSGQLTFGPDGYLYVGIGDHGFEPDRDNRAQDKKSLFGKILRLDVESSTNGYRIPPDNPFVGNSDYAPEIWALGLRNPFRFSFDRATGDWYAGDVGQLTWEELNYKAAASPAGVNYGWPIREGKHMYQFPPSGTYPAMTDPFFEIQHVAGPAAIISGFVYRGPSSPRMDGLYFFSDFYSGTIRAAKRVGNSWQVETVAETGRFISSFGEDSVGRLYVTDYLAGEFLLLEDNGQAAAPRFSPNDEIIYSDAIVLSCISTGATLHYTLDGSEPDQAAPSVISGGSVTVTNGTTLKARAFRNDLLPSEITSTAYTLKAATPAFIPPHGPIFAGNLIALSSRTPGSTIRYTLDGSDPGPGSTVYTTPIPYDPAATLKARAFKAGFLDSSVATFSEQPLKFDPVDIVGFYNETAIRWQSKTGFVYQLQFSDDLATWFNAIPPIPGTGAQLSHTNVQVFPLRTSRNFRVHAVQP